MFEEQRHSESSSSSFPIPFELLFLIGMIAISFSAIFVRWSEAPVAVIAMNRLLLTNLIMSPLLWRYRHQMLHFTKRQWAALLLSGFMLGMHFLLWMASLRYTTVASSTIILTLEPILVLLGSYYFFGARANRSMILGMSLALFGALAIGWGDFGLSERALWGDVLSFLGTAAVAVHMLLGKHLRETIPAYVYSFWVFFFAAISLLVYNLSTKTNLIAYDEREWGLFLLLAIVPTLFGHYLFNWMLKYIHPAAVSMTVLGEPVGAALLAYLLLDESISVLQSLAGVIILFGVWIFIRSEKNLHPRE